MYYQTETARVFSSHSEIRSALSNVGFSEVITHDDLAYCGIFPLRSVPPEVAAGQIAVPGAVEWIDEQWTQQWEIRAMTPEEITASKPPVPQQISSGQGREALYNVGLFANVQPAIDAIADADAKWRVQNAWDYRPTWERQSPFVAMMAGILGLGDGALDELFINAARL